MMNSMQFLKEYKSQLLYFGTHFFLWKRMTGKNLKFLERDFKPNAIVTCIKSIRYTFCYIIVNVLELYLSTFLKYLYFT